MVTEGSNSGGDNYWNSLLGGAAATSEDTCTVASVDNSSNSGFPPQPPNNNHGSPRPRMMNMTGGITEGTNNAAAPPPPPQQHHQKVRMAVASPISDNMSIGTGATSLNTGATPVRSGDPNANIGMTTTQIQSSVSVESNNRNNNNKDLSRSKSSRRYSKRDHHNESSSRKNKKILCCTVGGWLAILTLTSVCFLVTTIEYVVKFKHTKNDLVALQREYKYSAATNTNANAHATDETVVNEDHDGEEVHGDEQQEHDAEEDNGHAATTENEHEAEGGDAHGADESSSSTSTSPFSSSKPSIAIVNECEGKNPNLENIACAVDGVTMVGEQAGTNVTRGYNGLLETEAVPITVPYYQVGMCPVNVHWHVGTEHYSLGEFDENGTGPPMVESEEGGDGVHHRRRQEERQGYQCHWYNEYELKFNKHYEWQHCIGMQVG